MEEEVSSETIVKVFMGLIVILVLITYPVLLLHSSTEVKDCIVKSERVVSSGGNSSRYMIFGKKEVYEDSDSWLRWKFNSADIYGEIENGKCYTFDVQGWRVPFLSWNRNIYKIVK